jgi:Domain of unknown function (DUF4333)
MNLTRTAALGLAVASNLLLAACGATTVDTASVEKNVKSTISGPGSVKVDTVDCPENQVAKVGKTFTCAFALADGSEGQITVSVADEDGTGRWEVTRPASGQAEQEILTGYAEKTGDAVRRVDCPDPVNGGKNARTTCTMELKNGATGKVTVTVNGGDIRWDTQ